MQDELQRRKTQHLDLALREEVEPDETDPLFRCVRLVHRAVPELRLSDIDLTGIIPDPAVTVLKVYVT